MYVGDITVHGRSGTHYDFWMNTVEHLERFREEGIYILTIRDKSGKHSFVHCNYCSGITMADDLLSEPVQKIINEKKPTHICHRYGQANFPAIWEDVKIN